MAEETPPTGPKKKLDKKQKIMIGAGVVVVGGFFYWRQRQAAAAAAAAPATGTGTDTGSDTSGTDLSGFGTDQGLSDEADLGYGSSYGYDSGALSGISSNADWYASALSAVEAVGYDPATAATALSAYLASQPLTAQQQQIVQVGLAAAGTPPMGTYSIIPEPTTGTTTTTGTGTTTGTTTTPVIPTTAPTGLHVVSVTSNGFDIGWDGQSGAKGYYAYVNGHRSPLLYGTLWDVNAHNQGLTIMPNTKYTVYVTAVDSSGNESAHSANLSVTTKALAKIK